MHVQQKNSKVYDKKKQGGRVVKVIKRDGRVVDYDKQKVEIAIQKANKENVPIISAMGTANKLDPTKFEISDIYKTSVCPLCKVMRKELKNRNIPKLKVVYSKEEPIKIEELDGERILGSISFVPSVAGLIVAGEVIKDIIKN